MTMIQRLTHPATALVFLGTLYLFSRLVNLTALPMVFDEAIYIRWASLIHEDPELLFISLVDGKAPFFFWLNAVTLGWFDDFLVSARMLSVLAGAAAGLGIYRIGELLYSRATGLLATLIYLSQPLVLTHDRLGLVEALFTALVIWTVYAGLRLARDPAPSWYWALGLGVLAGFGFLTKTPMLMFLLFPVLAVFVFNDFRNPARWLRLAGAGGVFVVLILPFLLYEPSYTYPRVSRVLHHNIHLFDTLIATLTFQNPYLMAGLREFGAVLLLYVTEPVLVLFAVGWGLGMRRAPHRTLLVSLWLVLPTLVFLIYAEAWFARYFLVTFPPVALLAAEGLHFLMAWVYKTLRARSAGLGWTTAAVLCVVCLLPTWQWNVQYLTVPAQAAWTPTDRYQYVRYEQGPTATAEVVQFLKDQARQGPIVVFLTPQFGIPSDALCLFLKDHPRIQIYEEWRGLTIPRTLHKAQQIQVYPSKFQPTAAATLVPPGDLAGKPIYFIANVRVFPIGKVLAENPRLSLIKVYDDLAPHDLFSFAVYRHPPLAPPQTAHREGRP